MAKNTGNGTRKGAVKDRTQTFNSSTGQFIERGPDGRFRRSKSTPYKGVTKESNARKIKTSKTKQKKR